jgi:hypothetical protein
MIAPLRYRSAGHRFRRGSRDAWFSYLRNGHAVRDLSLCRHLD